MDYKLTMHSHNRALEARETDARRQAAIKVMLALTDGSVRSGALSLRRLALKEITDVEKAQQTLDRRVNEWIGNNRVKRYLLTFEARET